MAPRQAHHKDDLKHDSYLASVLEQMVGAGISPQDAFAVINEIYLNQLGELLAMPATQEELRSVDALLAFAFGFGPAKEGVIVPAREPPQYHPHFYHPGESNKGLAKVIFDHINAFGNKPVYAQWEIVNVLLSDPYWLAVNGEHTTMPYSEYLSSVGALEQAFNNGLGNYHRIGVVAFDLHARRCVMRLEDELKERGLNADICVLDTTCVACDPKSVQIWTQNRLAYLLHDIVSRIDKYKLGIKTIGEK